MSGAGGEASSGVSSIGHGWMTCRARGAGEGAEAEAELGVGLDMLEVGLGVGLGLGLGVELGIELGAVVGWTTYRARARWCRVRGDSCPMNRSQNVMAQAVLDIPFHCGAPQPFSLIL